MSIYHINYKNVLRAALMTATVLLTSTTMMAQSTSTGVVVHGNVYGGGNLADVKTNTEVNMSAGTVEGNVYGGGNLGDVGTHADQDPVSVGNYDWKDQDGNTITNTTAADKMTGVSQVSITGGTIGLESSGISSKDHGNVFGGGKGAATTFECEKGMVYKTNVSIKKSGTASTLVYRNVYGGGEVSRVENDTEVTIGTESGTDEPNIKGSVFAAGAGVETHGYSALVRGHSTVTVQGKATVEHNVYGGGELASVGRYKVKTPANASDSDVPSTLPIGMPAHLINGGKNTVTIKDNAVIGTENDNTTGYVYGAGKGLEPRDYDYKTQEQYEDIDGNNAADYDIDDHQPKRMVSGNTWEHFANVAAYLQFVETLALTAETEVTITGSAEVIGSVFGGSESGFVYQDTEVKIQNGTINGNVFGGGRGLESFAEAGRVRGNTEVTMSNGSVAGNVYGGGNLGDVGTIYKDAKDENNNLTYNYVWRNSDANGNVNDTEHNNTTEYNKPSGSSHDTSKNTGICTVTISDGTIGIDNPTDASEHGNVFGAGKGLSDTFWCEKAIAYKATVEITDGTVKGNVYGGGQIGRVETDTEVTIGAVSTGGTGEGTDSGEESGSGESTTPPAPVILGSVFGAGAGAETHGYSALVRGDTKVTIQGYAQVAKSVYGGGEKASVGRYGLNAQKMPNILVGGGKCEVDVKDHATIGEDVFGAGKGVDPVFDENDKPQRMTAVNGVSTWEPFDTAEAYFTFLETLALVTHPEVTIDGSATVGRSVFGGGELGLTKGSVIVNIKGGTIGEDVYGGGALANTNTTELVAENYPTTTPETNSDGSIITKEVSPTTTVNLIGGTIMGDAYGGGLGQLGDNPVEAVVYGDITVTLGEENSAQATKFNVMTYEGKTIVKSGRIFGCNNLNGSPQGDVTVRVWKTVAGNGGTQVRTTAEVKAANKAIMDAHPDDYETVTGYETPTYEVAAVYGGGNLANYTATGKKTNVIIETCDVSIESVYGGGNAAAVPQTDVLVKGAYEIGTVFGGGNGKDQYTLDGGEHWITNPGANVNGNANTLLTGGYVHEAYGGSNEKGTITGDVTIDVGQGGCCDLDLGKLVGAGKNADVNGDLKIIMGCKPEVKVPLVFGGADNANVNGDVELTITSGNWGTVVGGNNNGGIIMGHIILNIEETTCIPIKIDELYGCGYNALYSQYGYYVKTTTSEGTPIGAPFETADLTDDGKLQFMPRQSADDPHLPVDTYSYSESSPSWTVLPITGDNKFEGYASPEVNIISCTSIGQVFGGGYGATATVYGNPTVNINMVPGAHASKIDRDGDENADNDATLLGEIGHVYGGGNQAAVYGNTKVNIGTKTTESVYVFADPNTEDDVEEYVLQYDETEGVAPKTPKTLSKDVTGAYITGNVYGGGNEADVTGNTFVNICAKEETDGSYTSVAFGGSASGVTIGGNVYGGGKGKADNFLCNKAMVGVNDAGADKNKYPNGYPDGNTMINIGNGTVNGSVYGGGEIGRVEMNTTVTIGLAGTTTSNPDIKGSVFGGGKGDEEHGYAALVRGNPTVTIQAAAKVEHNVYGGGEIASVARYKVPKSDEELAAAIAEGYTNAVIGRPYALKDVKSGFCTVNVLGNAIIGPDTPMKMYHKVNDVIPADDTPDDAGHVFGAGRGILPKNYAYDSNEVGHKPRSRNNEDGWDWFGDVNEYIAFIQTLALSSQTTVTIGDKNDSNCNPFVKGSVYGGSENGIVQFDTNVNIESGQIGCGKNTTNRHIDDYPTVWDDDFELPTNVDLECASWDYGSDTNADGKKDLFAPYDPNANATGDLDKYPAVGTATAKSTEGGRRIATDGHTYYGNVFGGGSGSVPYFDTTKGVSRYIMSAGWVKGNTNVTISGGHILTNVYGGNEATNVDGTATITMTGGTIGVPRTLQQIVDHPVTCYLFGAGKGDQRIFFNKDTNVKDVVVNLTGGRIYGSVFGGGEDGHVLRDVTMTIGTAATAAVGEESDEGYQPAVAASGPTIGTWGTSYVDGNVFGGGRGFGGDAYTAGNVAGSVTMEIKGGAILGSVFGGGRLGSVGYGLFDATTDGQPTPGYGEMRADSDTETGFSTAGFFTKGRGHIDITISGGTIGNDWEFVNVPTNISDNDLDAWKTTNHVPYTEYETTTETIEENSTTTTLYHHRLKHTKGGNVFAGGMGRFYQLDGSTFISSVDWRKLGCVKSTKLTITGGIIKSNVYGGGELGQVVGHHTSTTVGTEISISGSAQIGTEVKNGGTTEYTFGSVFGGGYGSLRDDIPFNGETTHPKFDAGLVKEDTKIDMQGGAVKASIYGGGEMASVGSVGESNSVVGSTYVTVSGGTVGIQPITVSGTKRYFGGAKMGNVYGGGSGYNNTVRSGRILKNTNVTISDGTIYHNVYGGGAYGTVGDFDYQTGSDYDGGPVKVQGVNGLATEGTGVATVTIKGGTIGYDGNENGMVFGSSRGDINEPGKRDDHCAWVYDTNVIIGTEGSETGPQIKGTVYGSGENGHTYNNTVVTVNSGTIGIESGMPLLSNGKTCEGAAYPYRGNVYGGGCGTDTYPVTVTEGQGQSTVTKTIQAFNSLAGIVYGTTTVNINGGKVVRNVYGAGAMGSVGKTTWTTTTTTTGDVTTTTKSATTSGGSTTININDGTIGVSGTVGDGNVFGAARGSKAVVQADRDDIARVSVTNVNVSGGLVKGNVYGGGELGDVGTIVKNTTDYNYTWEKSDGGSNVAGNNKITGTNTNTGICNVTITGGTIGSTTAGTGNVFGGGKGDANTWWCEKAIAFAANVSISKGSNATAAPVVYGTVYGGGEVGRVEDDTKVIIGTANGSDEPDIKGNVFGAGKGMATRGYSALVRGNSIVTIQGNAKVGGNVFGGGEEASLGRFNLVGGLPKSPASGGSSEVTIQDNAKIGSSGTGNHVYGAGQGVNPNYVTDTTNPNKYKDYKSMQLYDNRPKDDKDVKGTYWDYYVDDDGNEDRRFVWVYYKTEPEYQAFLNTLALASHPKVTVAENAIVYGDVYGGGQRGMTLGDVDVNITGGTVMQDVYGGGSLADTNKGNWDNGGWATGKYNSTTHVTEYTTKVALTGGTINRNVYGGGLGRLAKEADGTPGADGYVPAVSAVEAKVYGDVLVELNKPTSTTTGEGESATTTTTYGDCEVKGTIFGCNNLNGSPQSGVTVHVYKTVTKSEGAVQGKPTKNTNTYEMTGVYGGGNLAAYYPDDATTRGIAKTNVIIDGCDLTSIKSVYGGGNAASVPETDVIVNGTYEIGEVFGGGNGNDDVSYDGGTTYVTNPGANVGYLPYTDDSEKASKVYGIGKSHATIYGGTVHKVYGGSNLRGNVRVESRTTLIEESDCEYNVDEAYGGGNNAPQDGDAVLDAGCIQGLDIAYGGASNADVNGDVILNITNGTYGRVFGGNNLGGIIRGTITVNIEETGCRPIVIGELYGGGNLAPYTVENIDKSRTDLNFSDPTAENYYKNFPKVNVKSFTSIGTIFGGGFGTPATLEGNPQVNINVYEGKYYKTFHSKDNTIGENAKVVGTHVKYSASDTGYADGYPIPKHEKGKIGSINNVFGGGNEAEVIGNPTLNIGTEAGEEVYVEVEVKTGESVAGYYTRTGAGTTESPYAYTAASGTADAETHYYLKTAKAVDIRGDVYGGGNNAKVTGNTEVQIGKKITQ